MRNVRVILLGNAANIYTNPYFIYFGLTVPYNTDIKLFKDGLILVQYMKNEEYRQAKKQTRFGKLVSGTPFENYAINNKQLDENRDFIEHKQVTARFSFAFTYNQETFGVWFDYTLGKIYVSKDYDPNTPFMFACTLADHKPNTLLLSVAKTYHCWKTFITNYKLGNVYYENLKIKYIICNIIKDITSI